MGCGCYYNGYSSSSSINHNTRKLNLGTCSGIDSTLVTQLKEKVICEFLKFLRSLEKGHNLDYEFILEEISLINLIDDSQMSLEDALFYLEFYLNNEFISKWQIL